MANQRVVVISDLHLSAERPFFFHNWDVAVEWIVGERPDIVVCCGDIALNAPASPSDLDFAMAELSRLPCPVHAIPGNHDVGNNVPDVRGEHAFSEALRNAYLAAAGPDRFSVVLGEFAFIGINGMMAGSGVPAEVEQLAWLEDVLSEHRGREVVLIMHKPLFRHSPDEIELHQGSLYFEPRAVLSSILARHGVHRVISGHNHEFLHEIRHGVEFIWAPPTAFINDGGTPTRGGGVRRQGLLDIRLDGREMEVRFVALDDMLTIDVGSWLKGGAIGGYERNTSGLYRRPLSRHLALAQ